VWDDEQTGRYEMPFVLCPSLLGVVYEIKRRGMTEVEEGEGGQSFK